MNDKRWELVFITWLIAGIVLYIFVEYRINPQASHSAPAQIAVNFPPNGSAHWYTGQAGQSALQAPLTVIAPQNGPPYYAIRLDEWESNTPVVILFLTRGTTATIRVPLGRYRFVVASGKVWLGDSFMFGSKEPIEQAIKPLDFYQEGGGSILGRSINLNGTPFGNLPMKPYKPA